MYTYFQRQLRLRPAFTLIELLVIVAIIAVLVALLGFGGCGCGCHGLMTSSGYRDGVIQKFADKGIIYTTHEGELALPGFRSGSSMSNTWEFSVWDDKLAQALRDLPVGVEVRLWYRQHRMVRWSKGGTAYEVYKYEPLLVRPPEFPSEGVRKPSL